MSCGYVIMMGYLESKTGFTREFSPSKIAHFEEEAIAWLIQDGWVKDPKFDDLWIKETLTGAWKHAQISRVPTIKPTEVHPKAKLQALVDQIKSAKDDRLKGLAEQELDDFVYEALGLVPYKHFVDHMETDHRYLNPKYPSMSGRTTRMLVDAFIHALLEGELVQVVGRDLEHSKRLTVKLKDLFVLFDMPPGRHIAPAHVAPNDILQGHRIFFDHSARWQVIN